MNASDINEARMDSIDVDLGLKLEMIEILQELLFEEKKEVEDQVNEFRDEILRLAMERTGLDMPEEFKIPAEIASFRRMLKGETDRGCALTCSAYLQSELADLLSAYMVDDEGVTAGLLEGSGSLASFYAQIDAAYVLGLVSAAARRDLHIIRRIRNAFAHEPGAITFDDDSIASRCNELHHDIFRAPLTPRKKYVRVTLGVLALIHGAKLSAQHRNVAKDFDLTIPGAKNFAEEFHKNLKVALRDRLGSGAADED